MLLWLWSRPAATAQIRPLAWESPYAGGAAQEKAKRQEKKKKIFSQLLDARGYVGPWGQTKVKMINPFSILTKLTVKPITQ